MNVNKARLSHVTKITWKAQYHASSSWQSNLPVVNLVSNYLQVTILKGTPGAENSNLHSQTELKVGRRRP